MAAAIVIEGLVKHYGEVTAVAGIDRNRRLLALSVRPEGA
jgi:alkylated DNA nucleotide flippase Atl1